MHKQPVWDMSEHHQTELPAHPRDRQGRFKVSVWSQYHLLPCKLLATVQT